jgi:ribosome maturation factor RimP
VQFRREASGMVLRVRLDRPDRRRGAEESVSVEDCANVSRDSERDPRRRGHRADGLHARGFVAGARSTLRGVDDYRRFAGRRAKVVMREPIEGQGFVRGRLAGADGNDVLIDGDDGRQWRVPVGIITRANLEVEF